MKQRREQIYVACRKALILLVFGVMLSAGALSVSAPTTVYNGVDYKRVYDF